METIQSRKEGNKIPRELRAMGNLIKTERKKKGLSLAKLSELVYGNPYSAKSIGEYERGLRPAVAFMTLVKICKSLEIQVI